MWFCEIIRDLKVDNIMINFMPSWWYKKHGIAYGEKMYFDPDYRVETYLKMKQIFHQQFGSKLGMPVCDLTPRVIPPDFDNTYFQSMLGFDVRFPADQYPVGHGQLTSKQRMALKVPEDLWQVYPFTEVGRQIQYLNEKLSQSHPMTMSTRGILNEAVQMCSSDFYCDLLDEDMTEETDHVLSYILDVLRAQIKNNKAQDSSFSHTMMNCTCGIAGINVYKDRIFPYDWALYQFCLENRVPVGLHHCGKFDDFLDVYGRMDQLYSIDIGHESSIRPVLERFPKAHVRYILSTKLLNFGTPDQIRQTADRILTECDGYLDRLSLQAPDLEYMIPDENIFALVEAFR